MNSSPVTQGAPRTAAHAARRRACAGILVRGGLVAGLALLATATAAQTTVTLYGGARSGGGDFEAVGGSADTFELGSGAAVSASVDWRLNDGQLGQVFYSFQRSALPGEAFGQPSEVAVNISHLHLGGRVFFEGDARQGGGYLVGGLGGTFFSPGLQGLSNELRPSGNLGVGWQWTLAPNIALRTELRGYLTLINSSSTFLCSGGCVVSIRGETLTQAEVLVGLSIGL